MRTFLSAAVVGLGVFVSILGQGLVLGMDENILRAHSQSETGDFTLLSEQKTPRLPPQLSPELPWTDRLILPAVLIENDIQIPIQVIGYNPDRQPAIFDSDTWCMNGSWPTTHDHVAIGNGLLPLLDSTESITISLQQQNKSQVAGRFQTSCTINTHNLALDATSIWMPIAHLEQFSGFHNLRTQILSRSPLPKSKDWVLYSARDRAEPMLKVNRIRKQVLLSIYFIIILISSLGITSTILMAIDERRRELALLRSLGLSRFRIVQLILYEQFIVVWISSVLAASIAGMINHYWNIHGLDLSQQLNALGSTSISLLLYTQFSWLWIILCIVGTCIIALLPAAWCTYRYSNVQPAQLLRGKR